MHRGLAPALELKQGVLIESLIAVLSDSDQSFPCKLFECSRESFCCPSLRVNEAELDERGKERERKKKKRKRER